MKEHTFENYPLWIVFVSTLFSLSTYVIGGYIIYQLGIIYLILYFALIIFLEVRLLKTSCVYCYYYGKFCAFGHGKLSALFFRKGEPEKFCQRKITPKSLFWDFLVALVPLGAAIYLLITNFNWLVLGLAIVLVLLNSAGNGLVRGKLACKFCRQKELCCPASKLFQGANIKS